LKNTAYNWRLASLIFNWQKWRFSSPQTHFTSWLLRGVVKIATFANLQTDISN
jgi:hypothetical protein